VISEAGVPVSPSSPKKTMTLGLAIVLGLMAGGALTAFQEFRERFFRVEGDVRTILGLKFLGYLPLVGKAPRKEKIFRPAPSRHRSRPIPSPKAARRSSASCGSCWRHRVRCLPKRCAMPSLPAT
jgi:succinoglycan biosynthesis transport protein ExoP